MAETARAEEAMQRQQLAAQQAEEAAALAVLQGDAEMPTMKVSRRGDELMIRDAEGGWLYLREKVDGKNKVAEDLVFGFSCKPPQLGQEVLTVNLEGQDVEIAKGIGIPVRVVAPQGMVQVELNQSFTNIGELTAVVLDATATLEERLLEWTSKESLDQVFP
jgi:hypothetical protein